MARQDYDNYGESETGNWNSAKIYSRDNIAKHLVEFDEITKICHFGTVELHEEFQITEDVKVIARMKAIKRALQILRSIIINTKGVLKESEVKKFLEFKEDLKNIKSVIPSLENNIKRNGKIIRYGIDEKRYSLVLDMLEQMREDMTEPLNLSNLIFNPKPKDFNPKEYKQEMMKQLIDGG